jgi:hypothetical protein
MRRVHLFEMMDQPWLPDGLRNQLTDHLRAAEQFWRPFDVVEPMLAEAVAASGAREIVDLCSGGGGPAVHLTAHLIARGEADGLVLTDLFPNLPAWRHASEQPGVRFEPAPVDATDVPEHLNGARTLFNAFHHLRPAQARGVLADAARKRRPILIVEVVGRSAPGLLTAIGVAALSPALVFTFRPIRLSAVLLCLPIPIVPLMLLWEGLASCLRTYSVQELHELTEPTPGYRWEVTTIDTGRVWTRLTILRGLPEP